MTAGSVVVVVLVDIAEDSIGWGWSRLILKGWLLRGVPGLRFAKVLGGGYGGGFGLRPSKSHQGLFLAFDDEAVAREFIAYSPVLAAYRAHARELCVALLRAYASKGSWSGSQLAVTSDAPTHGPIAALTRASIHPLRAHRFWRMQPATEAALADAHGCLLAAGLGEVPLLRQATFTLWKDVEAMNAYARGGAHGAAIRAAYAEGHFTESMFVRFRPLALHGTWQGVHYD